MKEFIPLIQTMLWIGLILLLAKKILPETSVLKKILTHRLKFGSSFKVGPFEIGELKLDQKIAENQKEYEKAGEAAKDQTKSQSDIEKIWRRADTDLVKRLTTQDLPLVQQIYLQKLTDLVKDFNRNRHLRLSGNSSVREGDEIAYKMRAMAPLVFGQLEISAWLDSPNLGKRLAAIKYLDWAQDIEYAEDLAGLLLKLEASGDTFQAYHILLALNSMANQLAFDYQDKIKSLIETYAPSGTGASSREYVKNRILEMLS